MSCGTYETRISSEPNVGKRIIQLIDCVVGDDSFVGATRSPCRKLSRPD